MCEGGGPGGGARGTEEANARRTHQSRLAQAMGWVEPPRPERARQLSRTVACPWVPCPPRPGRPVDEPTPPHDVCTLGSPARYPSCLLAGEQHTVCCASVGHHSFAVPEGGTRPRGKIARDSSRGLAGGGVQVAMYVFVVDVWWMCGGCVVDVWWVGGGVRAVGGGVSQGAMGQLIHSPLPPSQHRQQSRTGQCSQHCVVYPWERHSSYWQTLLPNSRK